MGLGLLKKSNECPVCSGVMRNLFELPKLPMTELYEKREGEFVDRGYIDQTFLYCEICSHGKLETVVPPEMLYGGGYRTSTAKSVGASASVSNFAAFVKKNCPEANYEVVIDIGANDCSLLNQFPTKRRVAVDPNAHGDAELVNKFIEDADLEEYKGKDKLILCSHTIEHIEKPEVVFEKLQKIVMIGDYCAFQFPSLECMVEDARLDQVHHQHIHYYSQHSFFKLLQRYGFDFTHFAYDRGHYGTLMVVFRRGNMCWEAPAVKAKRIEQARGLFLDEARQLNVRLAWHREVVGYGASLMLPVLKYHVPNISALEFVMDEDESKHGLRYVNFDIDIRPPEDTSWRTVMVTAFNTRKAVRKIVEKLNPNTRDIIVPFHVL